MHLFADYLQPLATWIDANPNSALWITFLISFAESLAIIGSIVPGTVTMTAIGILAGSGVMRIDLTFIAAVLGAIAGDSISYTLGYTLRHKLINMWPFSRYPNWLNYGKDYFTKHGGKSVLIGRFVGPLRSIIPVIAGMLHMNRWHFLLANAISAIGWSVLYVTPGVLIGAASSELSAESATRLFIVVLIMLAMIWLISISLKWLLKRINIFLYINLNRFWSWGKNRPHLGYYYRQLTPIHETNHYPTAALVILLLLSFIISSLITLFVLKGTLTTSLNNPIYLFLQSIRTASFDLFFIAIDLFVQPLSLITLILSIIIYATYHQDWRTLRYWLSLCFSCALITFFLASFIPIPETNGLAKNTMGLVYPALELTFATVLFGFLIFYISTRYRTLVTLTIRVILLLILFLAGIAAIYLGDNWFTSIVAAYLIGITICLAHWIFYRRVNQAQTRSQLPIVFSCLVLVFVSYLTGLLNFKQLINVHRPYIAQYVLTDKAWWCQQHPLLPLYTTNRIGHPAGLFNMQYAGAIKSFQQELTNYGWKKKSPSFFYSLLMRAGGQKNGNTSISAQVYLNKKPSLVMTFKPTNEPLLILRLWRSNYHLHNYQQPIWLGSIQRVQSPQMSMQNNLEEFQKPFDSFKHILPALHGFKFNFITVPNKNLQLLPQAISPTLLFVKEPSAYDVPCY